ncbi:Signal transduction histidine kinase [Cyclonatronum proteinivorum]|uniref:histidine kinase n=2 Tax=Cyclonatronum proteinivorum TaxID=1457365 RepID=A0A345UFS9_9BACT|nr:Signal transduction histidine kinase [Cyclonatronum proteinivorum]
MKSVLSCGGYFEKGHPEYRRALLLNMILLTLVPVSVLFIGINTLIFFYIEVVILHSVLLTVSATTFWYVQRTKNISAGSWVVVLVVLGALLYFVPYNSYEHYGLYWISVFPPIAYFLLGRKKGRIMTIILAVYVMTYILRNYQDWEFHVFGFEGVVNVFIASVLLVVLISYFELSRYEATQNMLRDLELRKQAEEEAQKAREAAESANQAKTIFLANMSHELRTPISSIMGFTELMRSAESPKQRAEFIGLIENASRSLLEIINDILDLSKIDVSKMVIDPVPTELEDFLRQVTNILLLQARNKNILFRLTVSKGFPAVIIADPVRLKQVLVNLIGNAIKFTDSGTVHFTLKQLTQTGADPAHPEQFTARFEVTDTGVGIDAEHQNLIFDAFRRGKAEVNRKYAGTGLGLSISARLVKLMGGFINLTSTPGKGSTFSFDIPLKASGSAVHQGYNARDLNLAPLLAESRLGEKIRPISSTGGALKQHPKILLVDDVPVNTYLLSMFISKLIPGAKTYEARNGEEGVQLYRTHKPDLIFMDNQMPVMNGPDAIRAIRAEEQKPEQAGAEVPIITLTAGGEDDMQQSRAAGCSDVMQKPFTLSEISRMLKTYLTTKTG